MRTTTGGGGFGGAVAAEATKLWSVRAPYLCLLAGAVVTCVFTYYFGSIARLNGHPVQPVGNAAASSAVLGQFAVVVLGTLAVTSEYTTGSVRATLLWVPVRQRVQTAKALVVAGAACAAGTGYAALGTAVAWGPFGGHASFAAGGTAVQVLAVGLYYGLTAVLTVGTAFATRHAAGALVVLGTLLWALPSTLAALGGPVLLTLNDWLPHRAGDAFMRQGAAGPYPPAVGVLVLLAWALLAHGVGLAVLRRRDA